LAAPFAWVNRRTDAVAFLLAWIVPAWLLFEAVPTKLPHYVLPLMPAVSILTVMALVSERAWWPRRGAKPGQTTRGSPLLEGEGQGEVRGLSGEVPHLTPTLSFQEREHRAVRESVENAFKASRMAWGRGTSRVAAGLLLLIPLGLTLGLTYAAWHFDRTIPWAGLPLLLAACTMALLAGIAVVRARPERALTLGILASALLSPAVFGLTQPALAALKVSPRLAAIRDALPCAAPRVGSLGYREPSLVFLIGTDLATPSTGAEAAEFLRAGGCRLVFVEGRFAGEFEAATVGAAPAIAGRVSGFNINTGRRVDLSAYAVSP
ncbi:MAG TPA: hypothetical protein VF641_05015, partial [Methylobacterium sp.]